MNSEEIANQSAKQIFRATEERLFPVQLLIEALCVPRDVTVYTEAELAHHIEETLQRKEKRSQTTVGSPSPINYPFYIETVVIDNDIVAQVGDYCPYHYLKGRITDIIKLDRHTVRLVVNNYRYLDVIAENFVYSYNEGRSR